MTSTVPRVSLVRCPAETDEATIIARTQEAIALLGGCEAAFRGKKKILVKPNAGTERIVLTKGRQTELTEPAVVEGVVRAIREVSDAEILVGDAPTHTTGEALYRPLGYCDWTVDYPGVRMVDFSLPPFAEFHVPNEPLMFKSYWLNAEILGVDAVVSVAKMKAHRAMGATLCIKNLFGLAPVAVYGAPRRYLHDRLIRLPRVLVDLVALFRPCLNVVDGIVAANHGEWHGTPVEAGVILAGHDIVATDAVGMKVMGFDPQGDYPDHPFFYRQNAVRLAAEAGLGVGDPAQIEAVGLDPADARQRFEVEPYGAGYEARQEELRRGAATVRRYREGRIAYLDGHLGRFAALKDGQLLWSTHDMAEMIAAERDRCKAYTEWPDFIVRVVPEEEEVEVLDAYAAWEG